MPKGMGYPKKKKRRKGSSVAGEENPKMRIKFGVIEPAPKKKK